MLTRTGHQPTRPYRLHGQVVKLQSAETERDGGLASFSTMFETERDGGLASLSTMFEYYLLPILTPVNFCMSVPFGTCTTKIAEARFVVGPGCNRTIISPGITRKNVFGKLDPPKGSFQKCSGSRSCAEQKQICLGGDAWVSAGSIVHA